MRPMPPSLRDMRLCLRRKWLEAIICSHRIQPRFRLRLHTQAGLLRIFLRQAR